MKRQPVEENENPSFRRFEEHVVCIDVLSVQGAAACWEVWAAEGDGAEEAGAAEGERTGSETSHWSGARTEQEKAEITRGTKTGSLDSQYLCTR